MNNDDWQVQASYKFGPNQSAMLNVRAVSLRELEERCRGVVEIAGTLVVAAEVLVAESAQTGRAAGVVAQSFPGTRPVGSENHPAGTARPAETGSPYPPCGPNGSHGSRVEKSGSKNGKAWKGHFCPIRQCDPIFVDMK